MRGRAPEGRQAMRSTFGFAQLARSKRWVRLVSCYSVRNRRCRAVLQNNALCVNQRLVRMQSARGQSLAKVLVLHYAAHRHVDGMRQAAPKDLVQAAAEH